MYISKNKQHQVAFQALFKMAALIVYISGGSQVVFHAFFDGVVLISCKN